MVVPLPASGLWAAAAPAACAAAVGPGSGSGGMSAVAARAAMREGRSAAVTPLLCGTPHGWFCRNLSAASASLAQDL